MHEETLKNMDNDLLIKIATGEASLRRLAIIECKQRGLTPEGKWATRESVEREWEKVDG